MAGTPDAYGPHPAVDQIRTAMRAATHILMALPIYNYSGSSVVKNVIELMGTDDIGGKTVGFLCSAGGQRAYMSVLSLANALMLDFRCWIVPRFVYATGADFVDGVLGTTDVAERVETLVDELLSHGPVSW